MIYTFIAVIATTLIYTAMLLNINKTWYEDGKRTNDIWYEHVKELNDSWYESIVKLTKRIEELEQKINELSKKDQESTTHFEEDADKR